MADFELEELKFAFAYTVAQMVVEADDVLHPLEVDFMQTSFPRKRMLELGFIDDDGNTTQRFEDAKGDALIELPTQLQVQDKLALLSLLLLAGSADGELVEKEDRIVTRAARLLDVPDTTLDEFLL